METFAGCYTSKPMGPSTGHTICGTTNSESQCRFWSHSTSDAAKLMLSLFVYQYKSNHKHHILRQAIQNARNPQSVYQATTMEGLVQELHETSSFNISNDDVAYVETYIVSEELKEGSRIETSEESSQGSSIYSSHNISNNNSKVE